MAVNAAAKADKSQERFYDALRELFVDAKVEGESGFINLMRIRSRYYTDGVFPKLQKDTEAALRPFPGFRQELFFKHYDFFHRYFSPSGSIYFQHTPSHKNIYEKVYTDDRDVMLFWKTHMLYYVKTDRLFNSLAGRDRDAGVSGCSIDAQPCPRYNHQKRYSSSARTIAGRLIMEQEY